MITERKSSTMYDQSEGTTAHDYPAEAKQGVEPLREVLNRAVISLTKEIEMLTNRIGPVLRMSEPTTSPDTVGPPVPHSSEVAGHVYELHRLANRISSLANRVEL